MVFTAYIIFVNIVIQTRLFGATARSLTQADIINVLNKSVYNPMSQTGNGTLPFFTNYYYNNNTYRNYPTIWSDVYDSWIDGVTGYTNQGFARDVQLKFYTRDEDGSITFAGVY